MPSGGHSIPPVRLPDSVRPTVSVVVPCYNYGHFLPACVESILSQEGVEVEVIIVDDASPDGSGEIVEKLAATDDRIVAVRHERNQGHIATYNDGFARATGDYNVMLSADDLLTPGSLSRSVALLEAMPNVGFVYGPCRQFCGEAPSMQETQAKSWLTWSGADWIEARCRSGFNVIATSEVVMRASVMRQVGAYRPELPHSGDLELWMRAATVSDVGFVVGPEQAWYRLHEANMHKTMFDGGTANGQLVDLRERWAAFRMLFENAVVPIPRSSELEAVVRRRLARQAFNTASYAFARGFRHFPVSEFADLGVQIDPSVTRSGSARALSRRQRVGMPPEWLAVHPLWAPRAAWSRLEGRARTWRRGLVGV